MHVDKLLLVLDKLKNLGDKSFNLFDKTKKLGDKSENVVDKILSKLYFKQLF